MRVLRVLPLLGDGSGVGRVSNPATTSRCTGLIAAALLYVISPAAVHGCASRCMHSQGAAPMATRP